MLSEQAALKSTVRMDSKSYLIVPQDLLLSLIQVKVWKDTYRLIINRITLILLELIFVSNYLQSPASFPESAHLCPAINSPNECVRSSTFSRILCSSNQNKVQCLYRISQNWAPPKPYFPGGAFITVGKVLVLRGEQPESGVSSLTMHLTQGVLGCRGEVQLEAIFVRRGLTKRLRKARRAWCVENHQRDKGLVAVVSVIWI